MDRSIFHLPFSEKQVPKWPCSTCRVGYLTLVPKTLATKGTAKSIQESKDDDWEPEWTRYVFACLFQCSNTDCKDTFSCCGVGRVDIVEYEDEEFGWVQSTEDIFTPKYFNPPLALVDIPTACPVEASEHLVESFALFFADPGAALNCARAAIEAVLTDLGVIRFAISKGKRKPINLHQRILLLPPKYKETVELLIAVKWLGNAGSHDGEKPTREDARVTYDLVEHVLSEIYEHKSKKLKAIAKKVNKKRGPLK